MTRELQLSKEPYLNLEEVQLDLEKTLGNNIYASVYSILQTISAWQDHLILIRNNYFDNNSEKVNHPTPRDGGLNREA